ITWEGSGEEIYKTGFMKGMQKDGKGGSCLFKVDLVENDAPGAGMSEKGVCEDPIWGLNRARKVFNLEEPRADKAYLVLFTYSENPPHPLHFRVNDYKGQITKNNRETYRWQEFPADALRKGENIIELSCPEAQSATDGWSIYLARADEFLSGGGNPINVGDTSFKSFDGGETWHESPFGPHGDDRAEYTVRLSFDRYIDEGWVASPVIDLWRGESDDFIIPIRGVLKLALDIDGDTPKGTEITYYLRAGFSADPHAEDWQPYEEVGKGDQLHFVFDERALNRRYIQFKAVLTTENPLVTPTIQSAKVSAEVEQRSPEADNIKVVSLDNPDIAYSSINWKWEEADRPEFEELRQRENLDEVIQGSRTTFDAQVKLLDHATKRWQKGGPIPEYPGWDAMSILDRADRAGSGGMCIQSNNLLAGFYQAYGWQARLVNIVSHEVCEVWNDEFAKWIYMDASTVDQYLYDRETCEPLSLLDLHRMHLKDFFPGKKIDWMNDYVSRQDEPDPSPVGRGSLEHGVKPFDAYLLTTFMRMVPRNNWYEEPTPRPLSHGSSWWPWNGYVNWYDEQTPPKRQYSWHTDRPQDMWPDLNLVHIDATTAFANDRVFLAFSTYTPNFDHYEVNVDDTGWKEVGDRWVWLMQSGRNKLQVRAVNELDAKGNPSEVVLNYADAPWKQR
ncbi:MAG: hypothetical protein KC944_17935, partial [Candidatus Omnitrophica bacterium]|nr:hypothetical protein [Candidatus Omnitrophota bacterium]